MKGKRFRFLSGAAAMLCMLSVIAGADMISTDQALGPATARQDRARVEAFLDRQDARQKLQSMGIDIDVVKERLASLTDREVHELAQKFDTLPAGGEISNRNLIAILLIVLLVVLLI
jgi:hypothetical protein